MSVVPSCGISAVAFLCAFLAHHCASPLFLVVASDGIRQKSSERKKKEGREFPPTLNVYTSESSLLCMSFKKVVQKYCFFLKYANILTKNFVISVFLYYFEIEN